MSPRTSVIPRSPLRASLSFAFVPAEEPESPTDAIHSFEGINFYIAPDSAPYLEGATIDFVLRIKDSGLRVGAPLRKLETKYGFLDLIGQPFWRLFVEVHHRRNDPGRETARRRL